VLELRCQRQPYSSPDGDEAPNLSAFRVSRKIVAKASLIRGRGCMRRPEPAHIIVITVPTRISFRIVFSSLS